MYYFENFDLGELSANGEFAGFYDKNFFNNFDEQKKADLFEIMKIGAKFRHQIFDDYSFTIGAKSKREKDFECALRILEIIAENGENFFIVRAESGEIAGFWYIYDINYAEFSCANKRKISRFEPICGCFAGCLKKKFWRKPARKIMTKILKKVFLEKKFRKIKCETFATNPYIEGFLKEFDFECEGILKNETKSLGRICDVKIWGLQLADYLNLQKKKGLNPLILLAEALTT